VVERGVRASPLVEAAKEGWAQVRRQTLWSEAGHNMSLFGSEVCTGIMMCCRVTVQF
jgi:hypothetical protein